jgi:membrane-associated phospholipid phosphatase
MKALLKIQTAIVLALFSFDWFFVPARADVVTDWNSAALDAIRVNKTPPPMAARNLAILHASIFDACNGIGQNFQPYFVADKPAGVASKETAIAAAAHQVLLNLFPAQQAGFDAAYNNSLAKISTKSTDESKKTGIAWGEFVAAEILSWRSHDGSDAVVDYTPGSGPGVWIPTPPAFLPALYPNWPFVTCFALTDGSQFRPPRPPRLDSAQWAFDFNLTKILGRRDSTNRTPEQTEIALFWSDGAGTVTPPGHWNVIAQQIANQRGNTLEQNARLFALLNIALADAGIAAWDCKFAYNFWRPVTAIPNAAADGNPDTAPDAAWLPLLVTPNFPEYISGHSTFSGAAATVLADFYGTDNLAFTSVSDGLPGVTRGFNSFSAAAAEAGMSRIYGGIHFMSANERGLLCGAQIGDYAAENFLLPRPGNSHRGR